MKPGTKKRFAFIGKSMLWSLLLYVIMMLVFNWEEVSNTVSGKNAITVVNHLQPEQQPASISIPSVTPSGISGHTGMVNGVVTILKTITGIAGHSSH